MNDEKQIADVAQDGAAMAVSSQYPALNPTHTNESTVLSTAHTKEA